MFTGAVAIFHGGLSMYASCHPKAWGRFCFVLGLLGFASAHFVWTGTHGIDVDFAGLGSFYYRMEQCPIPEWCAM